MHFQVAIELLEQFELKEAEDKQLRANFLPPSLII